MPCAHFWQWDLYPFIHSQTFSCDRVDTLFSFFLVSFLFFFYFYFILSFCSSAQMTQLPGSTGLRRQTKRLMHLKKNNMILIRDNRRDIHGRNHGWSPHLKPQLETQRKKLVGLFIFLWQFMAESNAMIYSPHEQLSPSTCMIPDDYFFSFTLLWQN